MNFKHLYYFRTAARVGGIVCAGQRLHITPQTLSGQIKVLEQRIGCPLFERRGRALRLTGSGQFAPGYADRIFSLSAQLDGLLRKAGDPVDTGLFRVGITDSVPKPLAFGLLEPAVSEASQARIVCREGSVESLLADMVGRQLDLVLADAPAPANAMGAVLTHKLGQAPLAVYAAPSLCTRVRGPFPGVLNDAPMLLPAPTNALSSRVHAWLQDRHVTPRVVGEFDDWALMMAFGREGKGMFVAPLALALPIEREQGARVIGCMKGVYEEFYAILPDLRIPHPLSISIIGAVRNEYLDAP